MTGGEYIFDKDGSIWLRFGTNITAKSAMCNWDEKLIFGQAGTGACSLTYLDWTITTEVDVSGVDQTITTVHRTPNFDFGLPECQKQARALMVMYRDNTGWTSETITVQYRVDEAISGTLPDFTTMGTITLAVNSKTNVTILPFTNLSAQGRFFQFQFSGTKHLDILELGIYYDVLAMKYS